jgi:hypothetical protein
MRREAHCKTQGQTTKMLHSALNRKMRKNNKQMKRYVDACKQMTPFKENVNRQLCIVSSLLGVSPAYDF